MIMVQIMIIIMIMMTMIYNDLHHHPRPHPHPHLHLHPDPDPHFHLHPHRHSHPDFISHVSPVPCYQHPGSNAFGEVLNGRCGNRTEEQIRVAHLPVSMHAEQSCVSRCVPMHVEHSCVSKCVPVGNEHVQHHAGLCCNRGAGSNR